MENEIKPKKETEKKNIEETKIGGEITPKKILEKAKEKIKIKKGNVKEELVKIEREYIIPLRKKFQHVPRYKKTPKAIKTIKEFLVRHMKIYDRDLKKIKIDKYLNEALWFRGIKNPPHKIKVKAVKEGEIIRVELVDFSDKLKFKKLRHEKIEKKAKEGIQKKKSLMEKTKESLKPSEKSEDKDNDGVEDTLKGTSQKEIKEKQESVKEAGAKLEKEMAKKAKHSTGGKTKQKTQPVRKALAK